ncbi:MAG TPA: ABC transporter permease [Streptosporangiaceae bacterium]|nr:ABC transporter permease [Streptosporangiaceae bacterium]
MIRLIWQGVRFARGRAVALAVGMLVAAVAFSLLTASVDVSAARIEGAVGQNWRGPYDLVVLPPGPSGSAGVTGASGSRQLVQLNYLSTAGSGITMAQYQKIARLQGVGIAAPLTIVGYLQESVIIPVPLSAAATGTSGARVLTLTSQYTSDQGLSTYPPYYEEYVYLTPDQLGSPPQQGGGTWMTERLPGGKQATVCPWEWWLVNQSPFPGNGGLLNSNCYSRAKAGSSGQVDGYVLWSFPVLLAGIDPVAEDEMTGLSKAVTSGGYLNNGSQLNQYPNAPVLASTVPFDGDTDHVTVRALPRSAVGVARSGTSSYLVASATSIAKTFAAEPGTVVQRTTITAQQAWQQLLSQLFSWQSPNQQTSGPQAIPTGALQFWTSGPVTFRRAANGVLNVAPQPNPQWLWSGIAAPAAQADTGFRTLHMAAAVAGGPHNSDGAGDLPGLQLVGQFDPYRLAGFSGYGPGASLASYRAPSLTGADAASRAALKNQSLAPDGNMSGYAQQPPLLVTTLKGAAMLRGFVPYPPGPSPEKTPIGSIRIRVSGVSGSIPRQLARIAAVGQEIYQATGLRVVVTAGASPRLVTIGLPAGKFGRPALKLAESWTETGVALVILRQADRESVALFVVILVVCALFLGGAALAGVRGRRAEIGTLRALGWGRAQVFTMVLGEVVTLGVLSGLAGAALSACLIAVLRLHLALWRAALVLPVAAALATAAGLAPAALAAGTEPAGTLARPARAPRRRALPVRGVTGLAVAGMTRVPGRCALAAAGLAAGVAGLSVLLAAQASFHRSIGISALSGLVTSTTRDTDLVSAILAVGLGAAAVADVTYLNLRERAGELAALAASGWARRQLGRLLLTEALITAAAGSVAGAAIGLAAAADAFGLTGPVIGGAAGAATVGTVVALAGTGTVLLTAPARSPATALAADD